MSALRIISFLPAATEMIYLLDLGHHLVGRSHECDYSDQAKDKPIIVDCALDLSRMTMAGIDVAVCKQLSSGKSLFLKTMIASPKIIWQTLRTFAEVLDAVRTLGEETGTADNPICRS